MDLGKVYNENCLDTMSRMPNEFIDLTVTSPPYDNLRTYKGYSFDFKSIAKELYRVTKQGGIVVWVVSDATINGSETGTSFKQALYFKECGFNLHDTMIYEKDAISFPDKNRYQNCFEYMFILSKNKPNTLNIIHDRKNLSFGRKVTGTNRKSNGETKKASCYGNDIKELGARWNIWRIKTDKGNNKTGHPAMFPEQLANDHIISWSNEGDLVYDPFMGSGTTAKMAIANNRNWIGSEISAEYCDIIKERIKQFKLL
jgi:site-specific DNA-methyltransferase (adenine-specific)